MNEIKRDFLVSYNKADKQWAKWIISVLENSPLSAYGERKKLSHTLMRIHKTYT